MKMQHPPYHWLMVALVLLAVLFMFGEAWGQSNDAAATFQGRPAMAGAQAGQGALAGPPQGGLGVQGSQLAERSARRSNPSTLDQVESAHRAGGDAIAAAEEDKTIRKDIAPRKDRGVAKEQRSAVRVAKRAAKRTISRARHGTSEIDSYAKAGGH
jgi:hypothetical protein